LREGGGSGPAPDSNPEAAHDEWGRRHGRVTHRTVIFQDVTARREAEAALRELAADLERRVEERTAECNRV
jgi:hypothetical protein